MKIVRLALARLTGMFDRDSRDRDLAEELASHMELHIDDNLRSGMTPEEAVRAAKIRLGSIESIKEDVRERRGFPVLQSVLQDIRYALRSMRRSPGFTTVAVMTLAVAIGINAGVFTVAGTVLFGGYPQVDPDKTVIIVCDEGYASSLAAATLQQLGLAHATDLVGGFQAWRRSGLPVTGELS